MTEFEARKEHEVLTAMLKDVFSMDKSDLAVMEVDLKFTGVYKDTAELRKEKYSRLKDARECFRKIESLIVEKYRKKWLDIKFREEAERELAEAKAAHLDRIVNFCLTGE